jgi:hypothetical protein
MIQWVHDELLAWGHWAARQRQGGIGYPRAAPFTREASSGSAYRSRGPFERVPDDYAMVDAAVQKLHPELLKIAIAHLYTHGYHIRRTATATLKDEKTIRNYRDRAHEQVARHIGLTQAAEVRISVVT